MPWQTVWKNTNTVRQAPLNRQEDATKLCGTVGADPETSRLCRAAVSDPYWSAARAHARNGPSGLQSGHEISEPNDIEHSAEIVGQRGQAELSPHLVQATHQECALMHPLLDRPEWMFHRLPPCPENVRPLRQPRLHPVQHCLVLQPCDDTERTRRAARAQLAAPAH